MDSRKLIYSIEDREQWQEAMRSAIPVVVALFAAIAGMAYIIYRTVDLYAYRQKWKDYDECGL